FQPRAPLCKSSTVPTFQPWSRSRNQADWTDRSPVSNLILQIADILFNVTDNVVGAVQHGARILGSASDYGLTIYTGFQANSHAIDDPVKGRAIEDFVRRLVLYQNWLVLHPKEQQAALVDGLHLGAAQAAQVYRYTRLVPIAPGDIAGYSQQLSDFALETGLIKQHVDAAALLDNRYAKVIDDTLKQTNFFANLKSSYQ
ncbi:hypothetical protein KTE52_31390, partial [Burkholderia multivorans]